MALAGQRRDGVLESSGWFLGSGISSLAMQMPPGADMKLAATR
jgi:hypothetical protein